MQSKVCFLLTSEATLSWQGRRDKQELLYSMESFRDPGTFHLVVPLISWTLWSPLDFGVLHWVFCICLVNTARESQYGVSITQEGCSFCFIVLGQAACGILVSQPGIEPRPPVLGAQSPNHWTAKEVHDTGCILDAGPRNGSYHFYQQSICQNYHLTAKRTEKCIQAVCPARVGQERKKKRKGICWKSTAFCYNLHFLR